MTNLYLFIDKQTTLEYEGVPDEYARPASGIEYYPERDALLTDFGRASLEERYLLPHEDSQTMFARVACAYADNQEHAQRMYDYISKMWFMPATPVLSNGGTKKGLPISCYLNAVGDSLDSIAATWNENVFLAARGGGIGTYWGYVRSIGEPVGQVGKTSGIIPFVHVMDSLALAISQGSQRRGAAAAYLDISHPEILEFLEIRKPAGDFNRKSLNLHHGVLITDAFMNAVRANGKWDLTSPKDGSVRATLDARELFAKIVETRLQTGEPYMVFIDTVNRAQPEHHRKLGLKVTTSNLCAEITLPTGIDHLGQDRTAVCCLSSMNLETWDEWKDHPTIVEDVMRFLDNVLQDFIDRAPPEMAKAVYAAGRERSVGLGVMGFHSLLQKRGVPFESALAKSLNMQIFKKLNKDTGLSSFNLAVEKGSCPDAVEGGAIERFSHKMAVAPTASISIICGGTSAGIDPIPANIYTHKTMSGSFVVKNPYLQKVLEEAWLYIPPGEGNEGCLAWVDNVWNDILEHSGSVQHLSFLSEMTKAVFKTSFELDQRWIVELAADRAPMIDQSQSLNLFLEGDVDKWDLLMLHFRAWEMGVKSLYYLRSKSIRRAGHAGGVEADNTLEAPVMAIAAPTDYEECLACQ